MTETPSNSVYSSKEKKGYCTIYLERLEIRSRKEKGVVSNRGGGKEELSAISAHSCLCDLGSIDIVWVELLAVLGVCTIDCSALEVWVVQLYQ